MKHLGDITKINGAEIETVDVITGGSPCAERRGKDLPETLKAVLLMQSELGGAVTEEEKAL